jgi:hypothetical protein
MKKLLLLVLVPGALATACAPGMYPGRMMPGPFVSRPIYQPRPAVVESPVGRWDNVMMLDAGTPLRVLTMDGAVATGSFLGANNATLRFAGSSGEITLAANAVMRVDRLPGLSAGGLTREGLKGAALGAGAVGVLGLLTGRMPPARVFGAGSVVGAYGQAQTANDAAGPGTIYLAESVAPRRAPVAQLTPRSVTR